MRCEVVAVGTELLLGQIVDTNSARIGERLALAGIDCHYQIRVGDNCERIVEVVRRALDRSDAVVVCGGLGPTPDDLTREALAEVLDSPLVRDEPMVERIKKIFEERGREMASTNERQADRPECAEFIRQDRGTAPGLICRAGDKVVYALPGVPWEMEEMLERAVLPDLRRRDASPAVIKSRLLRLWGVAESTLAEMVAEQVERQTNPTIAFLALGIEGLALRITAKAKSEDEAVKLLDATDAELREVVGDLVFGVDDRSMERVVADLLGEQERTIGVAESLTGGLVGARLAETEGASKWFRGSVVAYDSKVKFELLDVPEGPVVSEQAASAMATGACKALRCDVGLGVTGVAGPTKQEGKEVGTVFIAVAVDGKVEVEEAHFPGDRQHVRQFATISLLDLARRQLLAAR